MAPVWLVPLAAETGQVVTGPAAMRPLRLTGTSSTHKEHSLMLMGINPTMLSKIARANSSRTSVFDPRIFQVMREAATNAFHLQDKVTTSTPLI